MWKLKLGNNGHSSRFFPFFFFFFFFHFCDIEILASVKFCYFHYYGRDSLWGILKFKFELNYKHFEFFEQIFYDFFNTSMM